MGRQASYTGKNVSWDKAENSQEDLSPANFAWGHGSPSSKSPFPASPDWYKRLTSETFKGRLVSLQTDLPTRVDNSAPWVCRGQRYQWLVLLIASLGWIFDTFEGQIFPASEQVALLDLDSETREFNLDPQVREGERAFQSHVILAAFLCGGSLGGVLFGMVSDRIGHRRR